MSELTAFEHELNPNWLANFCRNKHRKRAERPASPSLTSTVTTSRSSSLTRNRLRPRRQARSKHHLQIRSQTKLGICSSKSRWRLMKKLSRTRSRMKQFCNGQKLLDPNQKQAVHSQPTSKSPPLCHRKVPRAPPRHSGEWAGHPRPRIKRKRGSRTRNVGRQITSK